MATEKKFEYEIIQPGNIGSPRMTIINSGGPRDGKTSFMLSMPEPIAILTNDVNTRAICQKAAASGKKILFKELLKRSSPIRLNGGSKDDLNEEMNMHKRYWREFKEAYYQFLGMKDVRSIGIETGTRLYEDARYAFLGRPRIDALSDVDKKGESTGQKIGITQVQQRDYGPVKDEIRDMLNDCTTKHLMVNHYDKDEWVNNTRTGRRTYDGMPGVSYLGQVETTQYRDIDSGEFRLLLMNSTANGDIRGRRGSFQTINGSNRYVLGEDELAGEDVSFPMAALLVYPDSDYESWS